MPKQLKPMPVGSRVAIRKGTRFYGRHPQANPAEEGGEVVAAFQAGDLSYHVKWDNGRVNSYGREDLRYWKGPSPKKEKPKPVEKTKPSRKRSLPELVTAAEAACRAEGERSGFGTARFAFIDEKTDKYSINDNTACHAQVLGGRFQGLDTTPTHITTYLHSFKPDRRNVHVAYINWLLNESPWCEAFVDKDAEACVERQFALCTTDVSGPVLQGALVATRAPFEYPQAVLGFGKWLEAGLTGSQAYILASFVRIVDKDRVVLAINHGGHYPIDAGKMDSKCVRNFLSSTLTPGTNYRECRSGRGVHALFGDLHRESGEAFIKDLLGKANAAGEAVTGNNPFHKAIKKAEESYSFNFNKVAAYIKEHGMV